MQLEKEDSTNFMFNVVENTYISDKKTWSIILSIGNLIIKFPKIFTDFQQAVMSSFVIEQELGLVKINQDNENNVLLNEDHLKSLVS